jgi:hypothetical protein
MTISEWNSHAFLIINIDYGSYLQVLLLNYRVETQYK